MTTESDRPLGLGLNEGLGGLPPGWRAVPVDYDPSGDDEAEAERVSDAWFEASSAFDLAVPHYMRGHSEWEARMRAAMRVLADRLPPNVRAKRATAAGRQARAGDNVQRTACLGLVACRWRSA